MIIEFKRENHIDKTGRKKDSPFSLNRVSFKEDWKKRKYCCKALEESIQAGFIITKSDNRDNVTLDYKQQRALQPDIPYFALVTVENDFGDDHIEKYYPINNCPFCGEEFEYKQLELKEVIHKCKKKKVTETVCEDYTKEKIIS